MVQFNLLPDVKQQFIKAQRTKYLVTFISTLAGLIAVGLLLFSMFVVYFVQKQYIASLNDDIKKYSTELKSVKDVDKMLTVQGQLNALTGLHESKPVATRLFPYLQSTTPRGVGLSNVRVDFAENTLTVGGNATSLDTVKVYVDAYKSATVTVNGESTSVKAFSNVVLSSFARADKATTFTITMNFDPVLFDTNKEVKMTVGNTTLVEQGDVFQQGVTTNGQ